MEEKEEDEDDAASYSATGEGQGSFSREGGIGQAWRDLPRQGSGRRTLCRCQLEKDWRDSAGIFFSLFLPKVQTPLAAQRERGARRRFQFKKKNFFFCSSQVPF